jgi:hypothetical protein
MVFQDDTYHNSSSLAEFYLGYVLGYYVGYEADPYCPLTVSKLSIGSNWDL